MHLAAKSCRTHASHGHRSHGCKVPVFAAAGVRRASSGCVHRLQRCRAALRAGETPEQAAERRIRESQQVEERVQDINNEADWERVLQTADGKLIVIEVESEQVCQTGLDEEPELQWKLDQDKAMQPCAGIKHTFARTARECPDVKFYSVLADEEEAAPLLDRLGVEVIPTLQFWRNGSKVWEHRGVVTLEQAMGEGVLYFGDSAAGGEKASDYVTEIKDQQGLEEFLAPSGDEKVLTVLDVCISNAKGCITVYPAVLALARSFKGYAKFGRLIGDENEECSQLLRELNIQQVPTFVFYRGGKEVMRHVGASRGDLIGKILEVQAAFGVAPPPPQQPAGAKPRKRWSRARA